MTFHCLALAYAFAHSLELSPWSLFMTLSQAFTLAQNHEHTHIILLKIILAELRWACGQVIHLI